MNPIEAAVAPLKTDAIARAEKDARDLIARRLKLLEEAGWDVNVVAPYPTSMMDRARYVEAKRRHEAFCAITEDNNPRGARGWRGPDFRKPAPERIERFVEEAKRFAGQQYDAFVLKLTAKIGACDSATLEGNHVWGHSILTVAKGETAERWKTQQIVNCSVHGLLFNQWPTRKVK